MTDHMIQKHDKIERPEKVNKSKRVGLGQSEKGRLFFLVLLSLALTNLGFDRFFGLGQYFGLLSLLAPVPLSIAILIYGRKLGVGAALGLIGVLLLSAYVAPQMGVIAAAFFFTTVYAFLVTIVIDRKISPIKGVLYIGTPLVFLIWTLVLSYHSFADVGLYQLIMEMVEKSLKVVPNQKIEAKVLVDYIFSMGPVYLTVTPFLCLWACFFLLLRNAVFWKQSTEYPYNPKDMVSYRAPFLMTYVLVIGLGISLLGNHYEMESLSIVGSIFLSFSGVFYFFQGFGVYLDTLNHFNVVGFMRSFCVIFVIVIAQVWLALIGIFDTWFDFRKFFKKKVNEGDIE